MMTITRVTDRSGTVLEYARSQALHVISGASFKGIKFLHTRVTLEYI